MSPPGLEGYQGTVPAVSMASKSTTTLNDIRKESIRKELEGNLLPRDTRTRTHRKNQSAMNGTMSFLELGNLVNTSWKSVDEFAKGVFNELADEGREAYRVLINDYNTAMEERKNTVCLTVPTIHLGAKEIDTVKAMMKLPKSGSSVNGGYAKKVSPNPSMTNDIYQRKVSNDDSPMLGPYHHQQFKQQYQQHSLPSSNENKALLKRVAKLEERLAAERMRMRVRELEVEIERRKASEEHMRAELMFRRYTDSSRSSMQVQAQIQEMAQAQARNDEEKQSSFFAQGYPKAKVDVNGPNKKQRLC